MCSGEDGGTMSRNDVRAYYDQFGEREWARLGRPEDGALEFTIHCGTIAAHLPDGARVLDIGGRPGRYALWLAERGHRVVLADLSRELLDRAGTRGRLGGGGTGRGDRGGRRVRPVTLG